MRQSTSRPSSPVDLSDIDLIATSVGPPDEQEHDEPEVIAVIGPDGGSVTDCDGTLVAEGATLISDTYVSLPRP
ncbi:hypothetical protein [Halegenticoccus tardaugens]|uniref:hypothetical protein n=1 Tax=Halegenticoccus tardaugens TaxID=2071624 RepID=UPI00100B0E26|nr:hypothetical protein [Halegenticoccus tardaugens]